MKPSPRTLLIPLCALTLFASAGCSTSTPTKAEFVAKFDSSLSKELRSAITSVGVSQTAGNKLISAYGGCLYDAIKGDEELLTKVYDNGQGTAVQDAVSKYEAKCRKPIDDAVRAAIPKLTPTGQLATTTTTAAATVTTTTTPPASSTTPSTTAKG